MSTLKTQSIVSFFTYFCPLWDHCFRVFKQLFDLSYVLQKKTFQISPRAPKSDWVPLNNACIVSKIYFSLAHFDVWWDLRLH